MQSETVTTVQRPVEDVFRFVANEFFETMPRWDSETIEVKKTSEGRPGVGATGRRISIGKEGLRVESEIEVTIYEANRKFSFQAVGIPAGTYSIRGRTPEPVRVAFTFEFEPAGQETKVAIRVEWDSKAIPWVARSSFSGAFQGGVRTMANRLKTILESASGN